MSMFENCSFAQLLDELDLETKKLGDINSL